MKILITNDDGIYSSGLKSAYDALKEDFNTELIAPSTQKSGIGRAISLFEPIRVSKVSAFEKEAYSIGGTPTDSIIIGIYSIMEEKPDLVVSGMNLGENLSTEAVTTSGTIGAALEASTQGIPAIAASVKLVNEENKFHEGRVNVDLEYPKKILRKVVEGVEKNGFPEAVDLLNLNIPEDASKNTPIRITRLERKIFDTSVEERKDPRGRPYYWIDGGHITDVEEGTDVDAVLNKNQISITPISLEMTAKVDLKKDDILP